MPKQKLSKNEKKIIKFKKNANDPVDFELEKKLDPKYKTELCKSWCDNNICVYGNKCRFAHGKNELSFKLINSQRYKQKDCNSFKENGMCMYGNRCNFKHDERKFNQIERSYYFYLLKMNKPSNRRLSMFENISERPSLLNINNKLTQDTFNYVNSRNISNLLFYNLSINLNSEVKDLKKIEEDKIFNKFPHCYYDNIMPNVVNFQSLMSRWY